MVETDNNEVEKVKYTFTRRLEADASHALGGTHAEGEVIELDPDVAATFVEEGLLIQTVEAEGGEEAE